jgi:Glu-tRNA(Gln) amidotransferase subunit E-like FAD-binding protein
MKKFENIIKKYITEQIGANQSTTNINPANFKNVNIAPNIELKKVADVLSKLLPQLNKDINSVNLTDENSISTFLDTLNKQNPDIYNKVINQLKIDNTTPQQEKEDNQSSTTQSNTNQKQTQVSSSAYTSQGPKA